MDRRRERVHCVLYVLSSSSCITALPQHSNSLKLTVGNSIACHQAIDCSDLPRHVYIESHDVC